MRTPFRGVLLAALVGLTASIAGGQVFNVGEPAPVLTLPTIADGTPGSIAQYRGSKVMLIVFASW